MAKSVQPLAGCAVMGQRLGRDFAEGSANGMRWEWHEEAFVSRGSLKEMLWRAFCKVFAS